MSHAAATPDDDLAELVIEAGTKIAPSPKKTGIHSGLHPAPVPEEAHPVHEPPMPSWLRPILQGIESLNNAHNENALRLTRIEKALTASEQLPQIIAETRQALDQRNIINRVMFEALHTELKGYKDAFMLDAVLRPVVRDLITLYDDVCEIHRQTTASIAAQESRGEIRGSGIVLLENVATMSRNLEHNVHFILEVLERMDVTLLPINPGRLDKRTQRAVAVEPAESPDLDNLVIKVVKRGFQSRDRVVRAEEVVIQKWKEGCLIALEPSSVNPGTAIESGTQSA
jgi:molecular chaperone GrpE (heat shock protein)